MSKARGSRRKGKKDKEKVSGFVLSVIDGQAAGREYHFGDECNAQRPVDDGKRPRADGVESAAEDEQLAALDLCGIGEHRRRESHACSLAPRVPP